MKTIFRFSALALFLAVGAISGFAQDPCADAAGKAELDAKFRENYDKALAQRKVAVEAGKQYLEKYGACADSKDFVDYLKAAVPQLEAGIKKQEDADATKQLYTRFDSSVKGSNFDETYASGKAILAKQPELLDVVLVLGSIGYDQSFKKNYKYNPDTLRYAKQAISMIESGKTSDNFGLFQYQYKTKENALGWMNLTIGYIEYYANNNKAAALPYLYKASQLNSDTKNNPVIYDTIGGYYFDEVKKLADEVKTMVAAQNTADAPEVAAKKEADIKAKIALLNGYAERAIDAYARAHKIVKADPALKASADRIYKDIQALYNVRFAKQDGVDAFIASTLAKPMPDPTTAVTPVVEEPKTESTTGGTAAADTTSTSAKPAAKKAVAAKTGNR